MSLYESNDETDETESGGFHPDPIPFILLSLMTSVFVFGGLTDVFMGQTGMRTASSFAVALFAFLMTIDWIYRHG